MAINQRYELLEVLRDDEGIRSARGHDLASGQVVEVHLFLNGHSMESKAMLRKIVAMPRGGASALMDFGEDQGTPYVVTRPIGGAFREWVLNESRRSQGFGPPPPPAPQMPFAPPPPPPPPQGPRDPFAHLFQPPKGPAQGGTQLFQSPPPPVPSPLPPLPEPQAKLQSMGAVTVEFHRLFADDQGVATLRSAAPQPAAPTTPQPEGGAPGEFTLMFGAPRPNARVPVSPASQPLPAPLPPPPPIVQQKGPVAFALAFNPPPSRTPVVPPSATAPPQPIRISDDVSKIFGQPLVPKAPVPETAGEFTQMFQSPVPAPAPPPPPPPPLPPEAGEFTRMFQSPIEQAPPPMVKAPPAGPPAPPPMPAGMPPQPNRMTMANVQPIAASAFEPTLPAEQPAESGMTVEFNRLFDEPKANAQRQKGPDSGGMTIQFNRLFEPESGPPKMSALVPEPPAPEVGEFTRMFQAGPVAPPAQPPPPPLPQQAGTFTQMMNSMPQPPKPGSRSNSYITAKEGESTQMFQAPQRIPGPPPPRMSTGQTQAFPPTPQPPPQPHQDKPGEFTQMFQRPDGQQPQSPPPSRPGEFTSLFQNPLANPSGNRADFHMPALPQQPMGPPPPHKPNEFEELFGGVKAQQQPGPFHPAQFGGAPPIPGGGLTATSSFSVAPPGTTPAPLAAPYSSSPLAPAAGGSSYTQFMKAPGATPALGLGQQAPRAPLPPVPPKKRIPMFVWIVVGVLIALLISIVLFFALRKH